MYLHAQVVHALAPDTEKVPAEQLVQVEEDVAPVSVENFPLSQLKQLMAPVEAWYVPAAQLVQTVAPVAE